MPAALDRCVEALMSDPKFKPRDPKQGKRSAAFAVCTAQLKKNVELISKALGVIDKVNVK